MRDGCCGIQPGFTVIAILTLALGIGANTAIFSVVNATLLKPLPFRQPEKVVALWQTESAPGSYPLTGEDYFDWKAHNKGFADMALYSWPQSANLSRGEAPEGVTTIGIEANFFGLLGVQPQLGRTFATGEDKKGANHVAILSNAFWKSRLWRGQRNRKSDGFAQRRALHDCRRDARVVSAAG